MSDYVVVIAARNGSQRLPGKALIAYQPSGEPNLAQIIRRWRMSDRKPQIVVLTTLQPEDIAIDTLCQRLCVPCYRGDTQSLVAGMDEAIHMHATNAGYIARGLADNPLVDVGLADWRLDTLRYYGAEGVWHGRDGERITYCGTTDVWSRAGWDKIAANSTGEECEHPGLYFWRHMQEFSVAHCSMPRREYLQPVRTELDTMKDLGVFERVFEAWGSDVPCNTLWALQWLERHPEVSVINADVELKTQSHATFGDVSAWTCEHCHERIAGMGRGWLVVHCQRCGRPRKFYERRPLKERSGHA